MSSMIASDFLASTDKQWDDSWQLNVMSGVRLSRHYLPGMRTRNWGRIIFISSESGLQIPTESIAYGAVKAAVIATARGLAEINAGTGITVNSVLPRPHLGSRRAARAGGPAAQQREDLRGNGKAVHHAAPAHFHHPAFRQPG